MSRSYNVEKNYIGNISQLFSTRRFKLMGGRADGVEAIEIHNGDALTVTLLPDRGLDIFSVRYNGKEMAYHAPGGIIHPAYYNDIGPRWLRSFSGGFLATCGLEWIGSALPDSLEGLHGRHNHTPAENVSISTKFDSDGEPYVEVVGDIFHGRLFGVRYTLRRTVTISRNNNSLTMRDEITNNGFTRAPLYLLYHFNLGYPLISESTELLIDATHIRPADDFAASLIDEWRTMTPPEPGYRQRNYYHYLPADADGYRHYGVNNREIDTKMSVSFRSPVIDKIFQWKNLAAGDYIMGLEPAAMVMLGKDAEAAGELKFMEAGETQTHEFFISFSPADK